MYKTIYFIFILIIISCQNEIKKDSSANVVLRGEIITDKQKMYIKNMNTFDYLNEEFIIDSVQIDENGKFEFNLDRSKHQLFSLSLNKNRPSNYILMQDAPEIYYFATCAATFTQNPTIYLDDIDTMKLIWKEDGRIPIIKHFNKNQKLHEYFLNIQNKLSSTIEDIENPDSVWNIFLIDEVNALKDIDTTKVNIPNSFDNYMFTEVKLYTINNYLKWYESIHPTLVLKSIQSQDKSSLYNRMFDKYKEHQWNKNSFEYFKFTEKVVTHYMNIENSQFNEYYEPSKEKLRIASKYLKGITKTKYIEILNKLITQKNKQIGNKL